MPDEEQTISEKCETLYNKLNTFVASVISKDVTPKLSNLNTEVWGSDTQTGNSRIDTLNTNFNNLDSSITTMESDINNVKSDVSNLQTNVDSLNTSITNMTDTIYPIGSIYMSVNNTNPSALFGGTWERIQNRFLLASGSTYSAGSTGGEATHTLTTNEIPSHSHRTGSRASYGVGTATASLGYTASTSTGSADTSYTGEGQAHNNMPPYIAVYVWKRTA